MSNSRHEKDVLIRFWRTDHVAGDQLLWPPSPWPSLVYAEQGILRVIVGDTWHLLPSHRALWLYPGMVHAKRALGACRIRSLYFSPKLGLDMEPVSLDVSQLLHALILTACNEGPLVESDDRHRAMAELLVSEVRRSRWEQVYVPLAREQGLREVMAKFADDPGSLEDLTETMGVSRRTLERRFAREVRMSVGQWGARVRVMQGLRALEEGKTIVEAAVEAGYGSGSAFCSAFRRVYGVSPRAWRERSGGLGRRETSN
jgi:AraC-like DNA-binding protein